MLGVLSGQGKTTLTLYFTSFKDYYVKTNYNVAQFWYKITLFPNISLLFLNHQGIVQESSESTETPDKNCMKMSWNPENVICWCKYDLIDVLIDNR